MANEKIKKFLFPTEAEETKSSSFNDSFLDSKIDLDIPNTPKNSYREVIPEPVSEEPSGHFDQKNFYGKIKESETIRPQTNSSNTIVFNPSSYEDAELIAKEIVVGNAVIVNLEQLLHDEARKQVAVRIIDFICGVAYAMKIEVKRINASTFLFNSNGL